MLDLKEHLTRLTTDPEYRKKLENITESILNPKAIAYQHRKELARYKLKESLMALTGKADMTPYAEMSLEQLEWERNLFLARCYGEIPK